MINALIEQQNVFVILEIQFKFHITTMSQGKELLAYYQDKVDLLYKERLAWLSKFDQCDSLLKQKQKLMDQLKDHKDKQLDLNRAIVHHDVALLDQKLNVVKMHRENINNQYADAEEILKMEELLEQYPQQLQKSIPCNAIANRSEIIDNELNIHAASKKQMKNNPNIFRENNSVLSGGHNHVDQKDKIIKYKPSKQQLLKRQIIELKTNQKKQICLLDQQKRKLQQLLRSVREKEEKNINSERDIVDQLRKELKKQEERHKQLAQRYFETRSKLKDEQNQTIAERQRLKNVLFNLEQKVNEEMKLYQKQNKAKQTLILRKSEDFQEDYKARMRAKQRNLQANKDNYEKVQQVYIQKIKKLEETLTISRHKLNQTERIGQEQVSRLKKQLFALQKQVGLERAEKARIDEQMKLKIEQDKRRRVLLEEKQEEQRRRYEKAKMIEQAYKKQKPEKSGKGGKIYSSKNGKKKSSNNNGVEEQQQQSEEQSMAMSDLQNIKQQINKLENKLQDKGKKVK